MASHATELDLVSSTGSGSGPNLDEEKRARLLDVVAKRSLKRGSIILSSGRPSNFYFDMKKTTRAYPVVTHTHYI